MKSFFIRDTLVTAEKLAAIPEDRKAQVLNLYDQYLKIGYIDVRTEIGPDQWRRTTDKQRSSITDKMLQAFNIEDQVKQLLKTDGQLKAEAAKAAETANAERIKRINYRLRDLNQYCSKKLNSNRENPVKKEYRELMAELEILTAQQ